MQIKNSAKEYDVIIVGSGAGGMATKVLSEAGHSVAVAKQVHILIQLIRLQ